MPKRKKNRGPLAPNKYLSEDQVKRLKQYVKAQADLARDRYSRRTVINEAIVDVLLNSGLRAAELCQLEMRDLPHSHGKLVINVRAGKGCVQRSVEVSSALANRIRLFVKRYRKGAKPKSSLFVNERCGQLSYRSLYSKLRIIGRAAGIGHLHPHMLRHTYGTAFFNKSKNLLMLQDQLGHADPVTTAIYAKTNSSERRRTAENFDL